jgi:hypothetical protein
MKRNLAIFDRTLARIAPRGFRAAARRRIPLIFLLDSASEAEDIHASSEKRRTHPPPRRNSFARQNIRADFGISFYLRDSQAARDLGNLLETQRGLGPFRVAWNNNNATSETVSLAGENGGMIAY